MSTVDVPVIFGVGPGLFGVLTLPDVSRGIGVVTCAPFGHPNVCSYRPLRTLAHRLAEEGRPVLRFDWPGTGDSDDAKSDADYRAIWTAAIADAIEELRSRAGVGEVALVGLRIGATLAALYAESDPAVRALALLAPYADGRTYLRETRAFGGLGASQTHARAGVLSEPPSASIESSGFMITAPEVEAFASIDFLARERDLSSFADRRVLIALARPDRRATEFAERLAAAGAAVTSETVGGLTRTLEGTGTSVMPRSTSEAVHRWLSTASPGLEPVRRIASPRSRGVLTGDGWRSRPFTLDTAGGRLIGVLEEPAEDGRSHREWVVFLNSGRVRRSGPNRMMTRFARDWAARGLPSLRLDLGGIGDSDGNPADDEVWSPYRAEWYWRPSFVAEVELALDWLRVERGAERFVFVGICSGASWGFDVAMTDASVGGVVLLNPRQLFEDPRAIPLDAWRQFCSLVRNPVSVRSMRGRGLRSLPLSAAKGLLLIARGKGERTWQRQMILDALTRLRARGTQLSIIFSEGDLGIEYFERHLGADYRVLLERYDVAAEVVEEADHTFRPIWSQQLIQQSIERHLRAVSFLGGEYCERVS